MIAEAKNAADSAPVEVAKVGSMSPSTSSKGKECPEKDFEVSLNPGGISINKYIGNSKKVQIPASIQGKQVNFINKFAFKENLKIQEVVLPDTIFVIGSGAFLGCTNLSEFIYRNY